MKFENLESSKRLQSKIEVLLGEAAKLSADLKLAQAQLSYYRNKAQLSWARYGLIRFRNMKKHVYT